VGERGEILTLGHSNHELEDFLALLQGAWVELVADVRRHPGSRRLPHFERSALAGALAEAGIGYAWLGETVGGRRRPAPESPNDGWKSDQFRGYADHMAAPQFAAGLRELERLAREQRTAVMCAEAWWIRCHRRLIADALVVRGWTVIHRDSKGRGEQHELTDFAVVDGDRITYPKQPATLV
jgi:uncharacterized protein (DUF488 family)